MVETTDQIAGSGYQGPIISRLVFVGTVRFY